MWHCSQSLINTGFFANSAKFSSQAVGVPEIGFYPPTARTCANLLMSTSDSELPWARIESPGTGPRTCADGPMSTSEASVSPAGSVGPGRSPLGTRTQRRELSCAAMRHVCLGDNPRRARAPAVRTGVSAAHRPQARIAWGATPANRHRRHSAATESSLPSFLERKRME